MGKDRNKNPPAELQAPSDKIPDMRELAEPKTANTALNMTFDADEILAAIEEVKDSAPRIDKLRIRTGIKTACPEIKVNVIELVQELFSSRGHNWEEHLEYGQIVPVPKKGRNDPTSGLSQNP